MIDRFALRVFFPFVLLTIALNSTSWRDGIPATVAVAVCLALYRCQLRSKA